MRGVEGEGGRGGGRVVERWGERGWEMGMEDESWGGGGEREGRKGGGGMIRGGEGEGG